MHPPDELQRLSMKATERFKRLLLTGITDLDSLVDAVRKELPIDVVVYNASTENEPCLLVRNST